MTLRERPRPTRSPERVPLRRKAIAWAIVFLMVASVLTALAMTFTR